MHRIQAPAVAWLVAAAAIVAHASCARPTTPDEVLGAVDDARPAAELACTALEAVTADDTVHGICATADELLDLAHGIRAARETSGRRAVPSSCRIVPRTTICATADELAAQIDRLARARAARDGRTP